MGSKPDKQFSSRETYLRLLGFVRPYRWAFLVAVGSMIASSALEPALPALLKYLLDDGFTQNQSSWDWLLYPALVFGIFLLRAIAGLAADYAMTWVAQHVIADLRVKMFDCLLRLTTSYFGDNLSGRLMTRITNDVNGVSSSATNSITSVIKDSVSVISLLGWLFYLNWKLTLITLIMIPFISFAVKGFNGRIRSLSRGLQSAQGALQQVLQETIEGQKVVKIFGGQEYESQRFRAVISQQRRLQMRSALAQALQGPIVQFAAALALSCIMSIVLYQAGRGQATVGDFVSFITAMLMLLAPTRRLVDVNATIQKGLIAAESVFHILDQAPEHDEGTQELGRAQGCVEFENVTFTYPGSHKAAVSGLSFSIQPGEFVALVGSSGSGKTTVANLLPRFYNIDAGHIRVDGTSIADIRLASLRKNVALVSQDVVLFNDSVAANIAYGCEHSVSREEVIAAAQAAHAMEFIEQLPGGLEAMIGEKGVKLSGGQRQRLAIARALLKNAPILILDEATSALDTESERIVQQALDELMQGRATLVIAHRLSTIERADRIVVMAQGRKVEEGSHAALLAADGVYAKLYNIQRRQEMEDDTQEATPCSA